MGGGGLGGHPHSMWKVGGALEGAARRSHGWGDGHMLNGGSTAAADLRDTGGRSDVQGHHRKHHLKHTYIMLLRDQTD